MDELKYINEQRAFDFPGEGEDSALMALCLSSRWNMCINDKVATLDSRQKVDSTCREMTATWVRNKDEEENNKLPDIEDLHKKGKRCKYFETYKKADS
jgi:DNA excision repair protein ERCC-2